MTHDSQKENFKSLNVLLSDLAGKTPPCFASMMTVDIGALSHIGKVRKNNEDHYMVARLGRVIEPLFSNIPAEDMPTNLACADLDLRITTALNGVKRICTGPEGCAIVGNPGNPE